MFDKLKKLLFENSGQNETIWEKNDPQLAEAALMFHVIAADGIITDEERARMEEVLKDRHNLSPADTNKLFEHAREADHEAIDLYSFTSVLRHRFDYQGRLTIIRNLWEMVFADGQLHELEDNVVWRVADLLDIDGRDRVNLKQEVKAATRTG